MFNKVLGIGLVLLILSLVLAKVSESIQGESSMSSSCNAEGGVVVYLSREGVGAVPQLCVDKSAILEVY